MAEHSDADAYGDEAPGHDRRQGAPEFLQGSHARRGQEIALGILTAVKATIGLDGHLLAARGTEAKDFGHGIAREKPFKRRELGDGFTVQSKRSAVDNRSGFQRVRDAAAMAACDHKAPGSPRRVHPAFRCGSTRPAPLDCNPRRK